MKGQFRLPLVAFSAAIALSMTAMPAMANGAYSTARISVDYSDLDLASPSGRQVLERRVASAIRTICGAPVLGTRDEAEALAACREEASVAVTPKIRKILANPATKVAAK